MAEQTIIHTKLDGALVFASQSTAGNGGFNSSTGAANTGSQTYTVNYEAGDLSLTVPDPAISNYLDRGKLGATPSVRYGDDQPITFSFSAYFRDLVSSGDVGLMDILNRTGVVGSSWISTLSSSGSTDNAEVFAVDLRWEVTNAGDATDTHRLVLPFCTLNYSLSEGDPNSISISGTSWSVAPSVLV